MNPMRTWLVLLACVSLARISCDASAAQIDLQANALAYSQQTQLLYATIPSSAGVPFGNTLLAIDPLHADIIDSVFVGSEPGPIAISPDSPVAYVGLNGAAAVRPVALDTMTSGTQFSLGVSDIFGPLYAADLAVMPGSPGSVAVSRRDSGFSPSYQGVAIFDDGVMRPVADSSFTGGNTIAFGDDPNVLFGYDNEVSDFNLCRYSIDGSGIAGQACVSNVISGYGVTISYDGGTIFATSGASVDGSTLTLQGTYGASGSVVVDGDRVIFVEGNIVEIFDRATYIPLQSFALISTGGAVVDASTCGTACVAVAYDSGRILLFSYGDSLFADGFETQAARTKPRP